MRVIEPGIVWTIGHGIRPLEELIALLRAHGVTCLIDVRTVPRSRRNPQFNRDTLPEALGAAAIAYAHAPQLGGFRRPRADSPNTGWRNAGFRGYADHMQTREFVEGLEALLERAREMRVSIMCAESVPWRCHRSLVADALVARGIAVRHILSADRAEPHALTPWTRMEGTRLTYPGPAAGTTATGG